MGNEPKGKNPDTSAKRVAKHREKERSKGRKGISVLLSVEASALLQREMGDEKTISEILSTAVVETYGS